MQLNILYCIWIGIFICVKKGDCSDKDKERTIDKISRLVREINGGNIQVFSSQPDDELEDEHFSSEGKWRHIPLEVDCPEQDCPAISTEKPCPEATPLENTFVFQGRDCPGCSTEWDPQSCKVSIDSEKKTEDKKMATEEL